IIFALKPTDPGHVYYQKDPEAGHVSPDLVTGTAAANDTDITDIDPDWAYRWWSFRPPVPLPAITGPVTIDGYTQAGATGNELAVGDNAILRIELNGKNA